MIQSSPKTLVELQYLRALAIVLTLFAHWAFMMVKPDPAYFYIIYNYAQFWGGVDIFFCLSGYIISRSLFTEFDARQDNSSVMKSFYIKRVFRIMPAAIFWASFVLMLSFVNFDGAPFGTPATTVKHWLASIFFVENIYLTFDVKAYLAHYWSLAIEEQFYLVIPWLYVMFKTKGKFIALIVGLIVLQGVIPRPVNQSLLLAELRYDSILYGVLIFCLERDGHLAAIFAYLKKHNWVTRTLVLLGLVLLLYGPVIAGKINYAFSVVAIASALIVLLAVSQVGLFKFRLNSLHKIAMWIGTRSYAMYLCHVPIFMLCVALTKKYGWDITPNTLFDWKAIIPVGIVLIASDFSFRVLEDPLRKWGRKLAYR